MSIAGRLALVLLLGLVLAALALGLTAMAYQDWTDRALALPDSGQRVVIEPGTSFDAVITRVNPEARDQNRFFWAVLGRLSGAAGNIKAGEYQIEPDTTPEKLLEQLLEGRVVERALTIVEGWRFAQVRQALANTEYLRQETADWSDAQIMEAIDRAGQHPEGRFLPETYRFTRNSSDLDLLRRANRALEQALEQAWSQRAEDLPLDGPEQALILASIVEKETGVAGERARIAGVFTRRLQRGMRLQTDPTVIYGMGDRFQGNITRQDLRTPTPYNTYTQDGLPPTPIALPGRAALQAATQPEPGDALFFVSRGDGSHQFSATLAEHNRAVNKYQRNQ